MTYDEIMKQLPEGSTIIKRYNAFENGEERIAVKLPDREFETRFVVYEDTETGTPVLIEKP
jgi:hypothetical protein